jgi:hypothetical protein
MGCTWSEVLVKIEKMPEPESATRRATDSTHKVTFSNVGYKKKTQKSVWVLPGIV